MDMIIDFLFSSISDLKINKYFLERIKNLVGGTRVIDLLFHFPRYFLERKRVDVVSEDLIGNNVILRLKIIDHVSFGKGVYSKKTPYKVECTTNDGQNILLIFFNLKNAGYIKKMLPINSEKIISGKLQKFNEEFCIAHPDYIVEKNEGYKINNFEPIYSLTAGISNSMLIKIIHMLLNKIPEIPEWLPDEYATISWKKAVIDCHKNPNYKESKKRLALDEILSIKQSLQDLRKDYVKGEEVSLESFLSNKTLGNNFNVLCEGEYLFDYDVFAKYFGFCFPLTIDQKQSINDIINDLNSEKKMSRLLQGDVGSGKTIVAFLTAVYVVLSGKNVAILAPTEMLAIQHMLLFQDLISVFNEKFAKNINIEILIAKVKNKNQIYTKLKKGEVQIIIGTHAIIEEKVEIFNLGYVIIDEQHKFGVEQRNKLKNKNPLANILYMSATPIPRTLMMIVNGDMDISYIKEKPKNRIPVETALVSITQIEELVFKLKKLLINEDRGFWVCPAIEQKEESNLTSVEERYEWIKAKFGDSVAVVHGKMNEKDRSNIINKFRNNEIKLLISTTVVEVGIDVPDATVIIIENAERFGLSQLHQLRGRVGRGGKKSFCILLYSTNLTDIAKERLSIMKQSNDGFVIAEKDLQNRGYGDYVGKRQAGLPLFKIIDPFEDQELFGIANKINITQNKEILFNIYQREL